MGAGRGHRPRAWHPMQVAGGTRSPLRPAGKRRDVGDCDKRENAGPPVGHRGVPIFHGAWPDWPSATSEGPRQQLTAADPAASRRRMMSALRPAAPCLHIWRLSNVITLRKPRTASEWLVSLSEHDSRVDGLKPATSVVDLTRRSTACRHVFASLDRVTISSRGVRRLPPRQPLRYWRAVELRRFRV